MSKRREKPERWIFDSGGDELRSKEELEMGKI
jgi:hypothetical protein